MSESLSQIQPAVTRARNVGRGLREASIGVRVRETMAEITRATVSVMANSRKSRPNLHA